MNETRMHAVWKLGALLAKVERQPAGRLNASRAGTHSFRAYLRDLGLSKNRANDDEREKAFSGEESTVRIVSSK